MILTNPPYVDTAAIARFPPEYAAEPAVAHAERNGSARYRSPILGEAPKHLTAAGTLVCEVGGARGRLEDQFPHLAFVWLDTEDTSAEVFLCAPRISARRSRGERQAVVLGI